MNDSLSIVSTVEQPRAVKNPYIYNIYKNPIYKHCDWDIWLSESDGDAIVVVVVVNGDGAVVEGLLRARQVYVELHDHGRPMTSQSWPTRRLHTL